MVRPMAVTLEQIVADTRVEVARRKAEVPLDEMRVRAEQTPEPRNFFARLMNHAEDFGFAIIAEVKRRSPSAGLIRPEYAPDNKGADGFDPAHIATRYFHSGAAAISCLTDGPHFGGELGFIERIKSVVPLPVIRKDFIVDPWQLYESRAAGADAVLLIAECLNEREIVDMMILAQQLQLTVLLEVHSMENLLRVRPHIGFPHPAYCFLGINNRDLTTMTTDIAHTLRLVDLVDNPGVLVSESGIRTHEDLEKLKQAGVQLALVGEHLMRQDDPGDALAELIGRFG